MLSMTFYEILGTESHVSQATIGRKRKKISDLCAVTYGKDSDRFHVISIIGSILGNRKSRKLYDEEGHTPFDHLFAPTTYTRSECTTIICSGIANTDWVRAVIVIWYCALC